MRGLETLKAENPDYCYSCGNWHYHRGGVHNCYLNPVITSLTAKCLEDEATIRELEGCLIAEQQHTAQAESQLSAAQATIREKDARIAELEADLSVMTQCRDELARQLAGSEKVIQQQARELEQVALARIQAQRTHSDAAKEE